MGVDTRSAPPLPAPTETDETTTPTELTADISKPGDEKSTYSLPEDGTPVTIRTRGHRANRSQTSLLIEYFEGSKSGTSTNRKPSVRVRLTPSKKGRGDHIQVTETKGTRKASLTRRIPLDDAIASREIELPGGEDAHSVTSYASATEESNVSRNPIDIEIDRSHRRRRPASPLIPSGERETYQPGNMSEISAIPTDSFLDGSGPGGDLLVAGSVLEDALDDTRRDKGRSSGKDRPKVSERSKDKDRKRRSKSRASSVSESLIDEPHSSSRRRSLRSHPAESHVSHVSAADSSVLSSNMAPPSHRSLDTRSMRSGASKSSINNPKLLETVEDAIRRLILPELSALKREQSKRESRRASFTSTGTSASREDILIDRRRSSSQRPESTKDSSRHKERRNREARHDYDDLSLHSPSRDSLDAEYRIQDDDATPKRSNNLAKAAVAGAAGAAMAKGLSAAMDDQSETGERKQRERRRRRTESRARSRSLGRERYAEEYDDEEPAPAPPMPLMSEINPSEVTRTSILSVESDGPQSATEELVPANDKQREIVSPSSTPTPERTPVDLQHTLGTSHANVSHGDLTALPRGKKEYAVEECGTDEFGRKIPGDQYRNYEETTREISDPGDYPDDDYDGYYNTQDVPSPLKYVPYQAGARGLSPIPSVSGFTEAEGEAPIRNARGDAYSPAKSPHKSRSIQSLDSIPGNIQNRDFDQLSPPRKTGYANENQYGQTAAGKAVRGVGAGANPNIVSPPFAAESAVASLIDGSMLDQSVLTAGSGYDYGTARGSNVSYDNQSKVQSSRGVSPEKRSVDDHQEVEEEEDRQPTPGSRSIAQSYEFSEYEIDEHGRKVPRSKYRQSPTSSEAAITAGAVGAAAAALKAAQERKQATVEEAPEEEFQPAGVFRNKSFKERAMEGWEPRNTPAHSMDRLDYESGPRMSSSGVPDQDHPMPEIGYMDDDLETNPSLAQEQEHGGQWSGKATPTEYGQPLPKSEETIRDDVAEAAGAAESNQDPDEWQRTSDERKRDTLVTNPYEDTSPIANPALNDNLLGARGLAGYSTGSPGFAKYDEGYMSNGPNRTPDIEPKGKAVVSGPHHPMAGEDPFYVPRSHARHLSGMSQGMASPFFDAATGVGIERIENKDIIALMQHLMVRDAQRSARDTEIVALLMNAALEMRNSFRDLKELVQDTGDDVIFAGAENTEKLQKAINGPRPYPGTATRSLQSGSVAGTIDEVTVKKKNLWKRALQGLSAKGTSDLSRIEDMLMQLLGEVDILKTQTARPLSTSGHGQSFENLQPEVQYEQDKGYEPEGNSTISHASQSGQFSSSQGQRKFSDHRISTVEENEEEYEYDEPTPSGERTNTNLMSPGQPDSIQRSGSLPPEAAPQLAGPASDQPLSADNTPRSEKGKKHRSGGSGGWLPKISRWSGTTASSVSRALRGKKDARYDDQLPPSRSGSSMASQEDAYRHDPYGEDKLHSGFSEPQLAPAHEIVESTSPPMPSYMTPEDPKYKAHRNSLNLQHPQPRTGQTERFRTALEHSAQDFDVPATPRSADWAGSTTSLNRLQTNTGKYSNGASGAEREGEYWASPTQQQSGPARPPKEPIASPSSQQTPPRSTRVSALQKNSPLEPQSYENGYNSVAGTHISQYAGGSPKPENKNLNAALGVPTRRPSGPRAMTPKSPEQEAAREERRRKRDTFGSMVSQDTDTF